jgi:hypothetical protein
MPAAELRCEALGRARGGPAAHGLDGFRSPVSQAREMRAELARMGSNLNQIAKALNIAALGGGPAPGTGDIARNLEAARELLGSVRDELRGW